MDPNATWAIVVGDYALSERAEAANNLMAWMLRGGFPPSGTHRTAVIETCEEVINLLIDSHDDLVADI